jgi:hypothetical protein
VTALIQERMSSMERWTHRLFPLAVGNKAWKNGMAVIDLSTGKCEPGHVESDLLYIGKFDRTVDASLAEAMVNVNLGMEIEIEWWANDTVSPVTAAMLCSLCYILDDQTVSSDGSGRSQAGRVWGVDAIKGVAVQKVAAGAGSVGSLDSIEGVPTALAAFSSNAITLPDNPNSGAVYDVPTTGAASTINLPTVAVDGTILYFTADGTKNGHTVTYKDQTGAVALTTALTASKRHEVIAVRRGSLWFANAYVSP